MCFFCLVFYEQKVWFVVSRIFIYTLFHLLNIPLHAYMSDLTSCIFHSALLTFIGLEYFITHKL